MLEDDGRPHVGVLVYETLPEGFENIFIEDFAGSNVSVRSQRISNGPFAGLELYLPFAVMVYVAAKYFDGFLAKAGEDHYELLSNAAKRLWKRARLIRVTAIGSPGKVSSDPKYTMSYAIVGEAAAHLHFKLILRLDVGESEADEAIDAFLKVIRDLHSGSLSDEDASALLTYQPIGGTALVTFDGSTKRIVSVDGKNAP